MPKSAQVPSAQSSHGQLTMPPGAALLRMVPARIPSDRHLTLFCFAF